MNKTYILHVGNLTRELPILKISDDLAIASFVVLGDAEMCEVSAKLLSEKITEEFDYIVTAESKGIPLAQSLAVATEQKEFIVLRKSVKAYMDAPITTSVNAITTTNEQMLVIDGRDAEKIRGKKVLIVDDVISTGGSLLAIEELLEKAGATVTQKLAILAEGDAKNRTDITFLEELPLFPIE
jgi:adenine phosphoribosyltransferase